MPVVNRMRDVRALDLSRVYEITEILPRSVWGQEYVGTLVQPLVMSTDFSDNFKIIRLPDGFSNPNFDVSMSYIRLRPLSQKDQAKLDIEG